MRPTLPMQKSNGKCGNNMRVSGPYLSSPVVPSSEEEHRKSPEPLDIALARDMTTNPLQMQALPVASYSGPSHNSTFISGFPPDLHFSSFSPHERPLHNSPFISQSSREFRSTRFLNYSKEEDENSWSSGHLQSLLDFPDHGPISNSHVEGSDVVMSPEGQGKQNEWKELIEKEFYNDDPAETNWNDFFADSDIPDQQPRVLQSSSNLPAQQAQVQQQHPLPSNEVSAVANPASSAQTNKPRMRWTPELHEAFVDAVNQLGGSERATPKGVLRLMNVEGLTIYHVKSHLQKYRTARVRPEPSEVTSDRKSSSLDLVASLDLKTNVGITEALKLQMEVQKKLHEQLEIQRKLQLEMEAQGKRLLEMFEQQRKMEKEKLQATSSSGTRPSANDKSDPSELDQSRALSSTSVSTLEPNEGSHNSKGKLTAQQTRTSEDHCPDNHGSSPPPMKRPKMGDPDQC